MLHIGHRSARHVVQNNGKVGHCFCNGFEVLVQTFLRWFVVVGHHLQLAVGANAFGEFG